MADPQQIDEMVERLRAGDQSALAELFSLYRTQLWRMVSFRLDRRLYGRVDESDVLQEAFIDANQRIDHFFKEEQRSIFVFLRLITEQRLVDVHRRHLGRKMRDARREISLDQQVPPPATSACLLAHVMGIVSSPSQKVAKAEIEAIVEAAINNMDPLDREVLALRHFEELGNKEVAEVLGLKPAAASNRYIRALKRLKEVLSRIPGFVDDHPL